MDIVVLGIDLGKNSCSLAGLDASGRGILRRRMRRSSVESFVNGLGRCIVAMEACCGAHHLGRVFAAQGHETRLMSPEYVRPYVKAQKNTSAGVPPACRAGAEPTCRELHLRGQRHATGTSRESRLPSRRGATDRSGVGGTVSAFVLSRARTSEPS